MLVEGVELVELGVIGVAELVDGKLVQEASLVEGRLDEVIVEASHTDDVESLFPN